MHNNRYDIRALQGFPGNDDVTGLRWTRFSKTADDSVVGRFKGYRQMSKNNEEWRLNQKRFDQD